MLSFFVSLFGVLIFLGIFGFGAYFAIKKRIENFSNAAFGTKSLMEGLERQADELALTPKSVNGMTKIFEPQIQSDFPDFNLEEFRLKVEKMLVSALHAIDAGNVDLLLEGTEAVKNQVRNQIEANRQDGITEVYEQIKVHRTEIARYEKHKGKCIITFQSAVEHIHYKMKDEKIIEGDDKRLTQTKYNVALMYIQDASQVEFDNAVGTTCPSCGAPITKLGAMYCEYCGLAVTPINMKVWALQSFYEVDYNHV